MKNIVTLLFVIFTLLLISTPVLAEGDQIQVKTQAEIEAYKQANKKTPEEIAAYKQANAKTPEEIEAERNRLREIKNTPTGQLIQNREEIQLENNSKLTEIKQNLVDRVYGNIQKQLAKRYQVLMDSEAKIQARIQNLVAEGKNLTPASDKLAESEAFKLQYQAALDELAGQVSAIHQSSQPFNQVPALRQASQKISNLLKEIRQTQVEAIKLIISLNN